MSMSTKVQRWKVEAVIERWSPDEEMMQALGLSPYWGIDKAHSDTNRSSHDHPCLREPLIVENGEDEGWPDDDLGRGFGRVG